MVIAKIVLVTVILLIALLVQIGYAEPVETNPSSINISLDGDWDFVYSSSSITGEVPDSKILPRARAYTAKMPVPGYWDDNLDNLKETSFWSYAEFNPKYRPVDFPIGTRPTDATSHFLKGVGFYRKQFDVPLNWDGRSVTLNVGGVRFESWFWLNGKFVDYHLLHNVPFAISLTDMIKPGEKNELVIAVANNGIMRPGCDNRGWHAGAAGIYRSVSLTVTGASRIADCYVYPLQSNKKLKWNVEIDGNIAQGSFLDYSVVDKNGKTLGKGSVAVKEQKNVWETSTFKMLQWSDKTPNLYKMQVALRNNNGISDSISQVFGLRTIARDGVELKLNGRPIQLRGICEHHYFAEYRVAPIDVNYYRKTIGIMKSLGFNWIRCHTHIPNEAYLQAADEKGIMFQVEGTGAFTEQDWIEVLRASRKHPSVVIYCGGNEEDIDENKIDYLRRIATTQKLLVPDALFNPNEGMRGVEYSLVEVPPLNKNDLVKEPFEYNKKRLDALKEFSDVYGQYAWGRLSYSAVLADWRELDYKMTVYDRPLLSHENGITGAYIDLDLENRHVGTPIGPDLYTAARRNIEANGLLDRASIYYKNSSAWMHLVRKYNIEMTRKCKYVMGYDMLGIIDYHWHRTGYQCGIMNEFYEMKPGASAADVRKYNSESVILLDCNWNRNLVESKTYSYDIMSSLYGDKMLKSGKLEWWLSDGDTTYSRGEINLSKVDIGKVEKLGVVKFIAPKLAKPSKLTLYTRLTGGEYDIVNDWNFWVFPQLSTANINAAADQVIIDKFGKQFTGLKIDKDSAGLKVISNIDDDSIKFLNDGGSVVLLGSNPFPSLETTFRLMSAGRSEGYYATIVAVHPITNSFPHDGFFDWQFYSMMELGSAVTFNNPDIPFDPIVEAVGSYKTIIKQSSLFEFNVGKGKLLVCSLNLNTTDTAAMYMLNNILNYANGNEFNPPNSITINQLLKWIGKGYTTGIIEETDMANDPNVKKVD